MAIFPKYKQKPPKRAHHDLSHYFNTSMAPGCLVPIHCREVVAGEDVMLDFESVVNTQALLSPLYGAYKLKICTFFAGTSLYVPKLWRNGSMQQSDGTLDANYPTIPFMANPTAAGADATVPALHESALLAYAGFPPGFRNENLSDESDQQQYNAIPLLMYYDIFRHYFANRQETVFPYGSFYGNPSSASNILQKSEALSTLDDLFLNLPVDGGDLTKALSRQPLLFIQDVIQAQKQALGGMCFGTYLPDRTNVILNSNFYANNVSSVKVTVNANSFQIDQLVTAKKLWDSRNKDAISSGTFKDWIRMHFGVTPKIMDDMPTFLGATSSDVIFQEVRATADSYDSQGGDYTSRLGDKGASATCYGKSRRIRFTADRPGWVMAIACLVPRVVYNQDLARYTLHTKLSDSFRPSYNGIGLQDVLQSDLRAIAAPASVAMKSASVKSAYASGAPWTKSIGKQPAWIEYMTAIDQVRGSFCSTESSWVLLRDFGTGGSTSPGFSPAPTAYIDPRKWNQPFADQAVAAQNFLVQFYITDRTRSEVLKRVLPYF